MSRPTIDQLLPAQIQAVLGFVNDAKTVEDLTDIAQHRPDLSEKDLSSYSIGPQSAQNLLETRARLRGERFSSISEVLAVKGIGEDKVLDIVEFMWFSAEEQFRRHLFNEVLGENWEVNYWRYATKAEEFERFQNSEALLRAFIAQKILDIARERHGNYLMGTLAKALLEKSPMSRFEGGNARIQFASWWYRFDEDNWFSFDRIAAVIDPFLNYFGQQPYTYIDVVFFRGFQNGVVAKGISPEDLLVTLNPAEQAISIWGISLFD